MHDLLREVTFTARHSGNRRPWRPSQRERTFVHPAVGPSVHRLRGAAPARRGIGGPASKGEGHGCCRAGSSRGPPEVPAQPQAGRVQPPADRHAVPPGGRRGHGLQRVVGADAAQGPGRRDDVPRQVHRVRRDRARRLCSCSRTAVCSWLPRLTPALLGLSFVLLVAVKVPGIGVDINGARRWIGAGPLQFQPSELMKLALVLHAAGVLATSPSRLRSMHLVIRPLLIVVGAAVLLDRLAAGPRHGPRHRLHDRRAAARRRHAAARCSAGSAASRRCSCLLFALDRSRARVAADVVHQPVGARERHRACRPCRRRSRWARAGCSASGSAQSVQKVFYLPEAHTDFILAVIGEELGVAGICGLLAALRDDRLRGAAHRARPPRRATSSCSPPGLTAMILCQALLNVCAVLGIAPVTGVPLPFISSGGTSLIVLLATMGLLLNIAARSTSHLTLAPRPPGERADARGSRGDFERADRSGGDGRARRARAGGRRSA